MVPYAQEDNRKSYLQKIPLKGTTRVIIILIVSALRVASSSTVKKFNIYAFSGIAKKLF